MLLLQGNVSAYVVNDRVSDLTGLTLTFSVYGWTGGVKTTWSVYSASPFELVEE